MTKIEMFFYLPTINITNSYFFLKKTIEIKQNGCYLTHNLNKSNKKIQ